VKKIKRVLAGLWHDESGVSSVEYALLLAFIAAGIITAAGLLSSAVENEMTQAAACLESGSAC
jgi:Flp pilus assembly pilin Flp